ncbi:hypothetical protein GCM10023203_02420 [Actinomycetospora straminea]|uniref:Uncharacterized protein n=1 Tax=Actinomycetospora straminea TaxID=663607 RepID=A0ABP9DSS4_9PSEU
MLEIRARRLAVEHLTLPPGTDTAPTAAAAPPAEEAHVTTLPITTILPVRG